ncbi:MAG: prolipoprotein diacylglyceryl transferase [Eubacteriaceae bacterium]|jgi:phosphatidylglycerol:prolipoprotein diacylglycerol transferase|nr:prolipoprotein diacylglyceryl transferase [Eubacteriaceae bacterium]
MHLELLKIGPVTIYGYGTCISIGFFAALWLCSKRAPKYGLVSDTVIDIALTVMAFGFVGAKVLYYITILPQIVKNPRLLLNIANGFVLYGGLIGGILAGYIYCRIKKVSFLAYFDLISPSVAIAQSFGRLGCFMAGCCYGKPCNSWYCVVFPASGLAPAGVPLLPTQLIMCFGDAAICFILLYIAAQKRSEGTVAASYLVLYSIGRFFVEYLRNDERGTVGMLSTSQFISIFILIGAISLFAIAHRKRNPSEAIDSESDDTQRNDE